MNTVNMPTLYGKTSKGAIKVWDVKVTQDSYITSYGIVGGKLITNERKVSPKNIGRANETTSAEQAVRQATSAWTKKKNLGYNEDVSMAGKDAITRRMRCHVYDDALVSKYSYYYVQPKLNGVKCFVKKIDGETISYQSSGGKQYEVMHKYFDSILLDKMLIGEELDTEIYLHGASLQEIGSAVKKENELTKYLQIWVYDMVTSGTFTTRLVEVEEAVDRIASNKVILTPHSVSLGSAPLKSIHDKYVKEGFEGSIIRSESGSYERGKKSYQVLKRKDWRSSEFPIVGIDKDIRGCIIYICDKNGTTFRAVPKGTQDSRRRLFAMGEDNFVGEMLTVKYSDVSDAGIPQGNPIAENVRMPEDIEEKVEGGVTKDTVLGYFTE